MCGAAVLSKGVLLFFVFYSIFKMQSSFFSGQQNTEELLKFGFDWLSLLWMSFISALFTSMSQTLNSRSRPNLMYGLNKHLLFGLENDLEGHSMGAQTNKQTLASALRQEH
jgi:hypothetical protein